MGSSVIRSDAERGPSQALALRLAAPSLAYDSYGASGPTVVLLHGIPGSRRTDARLSIVRERRDAPLGPWHRQMMRLVEEVLDEGTE